MNLGQLIDSGWVQEGMPNRFARAWAASAQALQVRTREHRPLRGNTRSVAEVLAKTGRALTAREVLDRLAIALPINEVGAYLSQFVGRGLATRIGEARPLQIQHHRARPRKAAVIRDYPAYGRTIAAHIVRGQKPICVGVLLSQRWDYFDHVPKVCIKPDEWKPGRFELSFLRGLHLVAVPGDECADEQLAELLMDLMRVGPALLWVFGADGTKLYDEEWASSLAQWACRLSAGKIDYRTAKTAAAVMEAAQRVASHRWLAEHARVSARAAPEDLLSFNLRDERHQQRVRELFSTPFREIGETRAA